MAGRHEDDSLSSSIRALFFSDASAFTTNDIMRALGPGYLRRDVSRVLYRLEEAGLIERILESPPTWISHVLQVKQEPEGYGPSTRWRNERDNDYTFDKRIPQRGIRMGGASVSMGGATPTHQTQILEALLHSSNPLTATEIAKEIGLRGAAAINPDLIAMEKERLLRKVIQSKGPLLWDLASRPEREGPNPNPKIIPHSYNTRSKSQSPNNSKTGKTPPARKPSSSSSSSTTPPTIATTTRKINMGQPSGFVSSSVDPFRATAGAKESRSLILQYLSNASEEKKAITIANDIGLSRHDVNSLLYGLEREGLVTCYSGIGPPAWVIKKSMMVVSSSIGRGSRLRTLMKEAKDKKQNFVCKGQLVSVGGLGSVASSEAPPTGSSSSAAQSNNEAVMSSPPVSPPSSPPVHSSTLPSASPSSHSSPPPPPALSVMEPYSCNPMAAALANELTRNPVSVLSEFCQIQKLELSFPIVSEHGPPHFKSFTIAASCPPFYAEAKASTKKDAKRMAADLALQRIRACIVVSREERGGPAWFVDSTPTRGYTDERYEAEQEMEEGPTLHDHIDGIAHSLHTRLELALGSPQPGRKVIACFIMEDASTKQLEVISFGSGTRTVSGDVIDRNGEVVNDSHAEIIARRGLKRFFYQELRVYYEDGESVDTIFEPIEGGDGSKVRVKDSIKFHLYISTAPCGDGAQFSRQDSQNRLPPPQGSPHCPTKDARAQGILRTKMEGGEGTIPIGTDANPQTWDGILQGGRLRTMSCSDKIGSWNVLGLQGSLLSVFMEPVYLFSLTLGSLHHHGHLSRAVCCRFQELGQSLRPPYMVNHPVLGRVRGGDEMKRHTERTSNLSMNWVINDAAPELTDGGTGRPVSSSSSSSQLSRLNIFAQFRSLCELTGRTSYLNIESYFEAKGLAGDYQEMKGLLYRYCIEKGYGLWMSKPLEMNQFSHSEVPMDV